MATESGTSMGKAAKRTARERLAEQRKRDAARGRRNRTLTITGIAVVVIIAVVVGGIAIARSRDDSDPATAAKYTGPLAPMTVDTAATTVTMAKPGVTKPLVDVYEDLQCPVCKQFEGSTGSVPRQLAAQGKAKVVYHLLSFVNPVGSARAAAAASCIPGNRWMAYHDAVYARQPDERYAFTVDQLRQIGSQAGAGKKALGCIGKQTYAATAKANNAKAAAAGFASTPTLVVDGRKLDLQTVFNREKLAQAIGG
ncbi:MAG TPA: thioredoxin domain-containing protein [Streptosporangiaceae bacterium]|jgi:protein-disulfide isomerase